MTSDELLALAGPSIGLLGARFYFARSVVAVGQEMNLEFFPWYVVGRGGPLGRVDASVVADAFGYFQPAAIRTAWESATAAVDPIAAGQRHFLAAAEFGRRHLANVGGLDAFADACTAVLSAADPAGLALYHAFVGLPLVDDQAGRAYQLIVKLREFRGSAHLEAVREVGLDPRVAHYLARPDWFGAFGWAADDTPDVTDADRDALGHAGRLTDDRVRPAFDVLDDGQRMALADGLDRISAAFA